MAEFVLVRTSGDKREELPLDGRLVQAMDTCLRMGLPIAPRAIRAKPQGTRLFLIGRPLGEIAKQESEFDQ